MNKNIVLVIIALIITWIIGSVTKNLVFNNPSFSLVHAGVIEYLLPLLMGVLIGLLGTRNSWKYALLYGVIVSLMDTYTLSTYAGFLRITAFSIFLPLAQNAIPALLGGFAGERIQELYYKPSKKKK